MRVNCHGGFAEGSVQDHVGRFPPHARQRFQRRPITRHFAAVFFEQNLAGPYHVDRFGIEEADGLDVTLQAPYAERLDGSGRIGDRKQLVRCLVDAHIRSLRRKNHRDQQLKG